MSGVPSHLTFLWFGLYHLNVLKAYERLCLRCSIGKRHRCERINELD